MAQACVTSRAAHASDVVGLLAAELRAFEPATLGDWTLRPWSRAAVSQASQAGCDTFRSRVVAEDEDRGTGRMLPTVRIGSARLAGGAWRSVPAYRALPPVELA